LMLTNIDLGNKNVDINGKFNCGKRWNGDFPWLCWIPKAYVFKGSRPQTT
jgi:hypothetical protein